jgi:hypothetical protein
VSISLGQPKFIGRWYSDSMKSILMRHCLSFRDVLRPAIAGRSTGPESISPAGVMDSGRAQERAPE